MKGSYLYTCIYKMRNNEINTEEANVDDKIVTLRVA